MAQQDNGMKQIAEIFEQAAEKFPKHKEKLLSDLGKDALQAVQRNTPISFFVFFSDSS